jgi:acyl-CoA thioesterase FadM
MPRLRLDLPESFEFRTQLPVRISDINYGGHLGNDAVLSLVHEARLQFLASMGYSEQNIEGAAVIMADAQIVYKAEGHHGDLLNADVGFGEIERVSFEIYTRLSHAATGVEVARIKTTLVCFDYRNRRPLPVPEGLKARRQSS